MPHYGGDPRWIQTRHADRYQGCDTALPRGARAFYFPRGKRLYGAACCDKADHEARAFDSAAFDDTVMSSTG